MWYVAASVVFVSIVSVLGSDAKTRDERHFEKCKIDLFQRKFDVLPGRGWDNLNNEPMGQILSLNFSKCQYSQDNIYLIPNSISLSPTKTSKVELNADSFSHFSKYTTTTSSSINLEAGGGIYGFSISGSFSKESEQVKSDQIATKSSIFRVQLRYNILKSLSEPDAELHSTFRNRILDIASLLIENKDSIYPAYLADLVVRDYGTHVVQSVDAGAILSKVDMLHSDYTNKYSSDSNQISLGASASFWNIFSASAKYSNRYQQSQTDEYDKSCQRTRIETTGGTLYGANFSLDEWRLSVLDNMVPIDRKGNPIYYVITKRSLPELDQRTVHQVYLLMKKAVQRYYDANTRRGCLDIHSPNFNADANVDAKTCEFPKVTFNFGGVYQTCTGPDDQCQSIKQVNPSTQAASCPAKYISVLLHSGLNECRKYCSGWWIFAQCHTMCSYYYSYWCYPTNVNDTFSGYRFGGFLNAGKTTCPLEYFPLKVGLRAQICVSISNDPLNLYAIKFGGLYSCSIGNPLAREYVKDKKNLLHSSSMKKLFFWPKTCAKGYVAHIANIDNGCEIAYCAETNKISLGQLPILNKPPFISLNYNPNSTDVSEFSSNNGKKYIKTQNGNWESTEIQKRQDRIILSSVLGTFFSVSMVAGLVVFVLRNHYKRKIQNVQQQELMLDSTMTHYGAINEADESA